ncbi:MAG: response regulator [Anaerolineales bacterium]|nr:response regulator [Anaerolineales bacterium]
MAKILIVDDDPDFVNATRMVLEAEGHTVISAKSGNEGFQRAREDKPDIIVLDVIMDTVLDGLAMSQEMHNDPAVRDIPIIMVTSIANTDYAELFPTDEYIHIRAFMSKPIKPADLIKQVNKLLPK